MTQDPWSSSRVLKGWWPLDQSDRIVPPLSQAQSLCDMQEAGVSSASEATALAFDCARDDDEDDDDDDDDDDRGGKGRAKDVTEKEVMLLNPEQERTVTMEVRQGDVKPNA